MPCLYLSTNVSLDGVDIDPIFSETTKAISAITGKPESYVMVLLKGSVAISFGASKSEPAAYGELVALGGITKAVKRQLIATLGTILEDSKLSIPKTRFFLKVVDYVMIVLKGSVPISFGGTEQPAAYGELVSIGGLSPDVNKKLSAAIAAILESKLSVPKSRFFLKFYDTKGSNFGWNGSTF